MFLKSLVLRGFKSFADKTTLVFEPGITIVVGPNGSGKSNVVDAISWVLGEQGPRSLRGGKMEDVIFAGSRLRPALGMAEVSMTIDNSAGLLPIEFSEVTISRLLFRSGESEYRLNGAACRLLDIQEVLSDTGIGREQHTIIGQGQLDAVLNADSTQMRGFIEEAAGVGKHRRRKDRAVRKIGSTEQNLVRLGDLLSEVRRQLRPLREQAEVAKKHSSMADEFARIRLIMSTRELADVRRRLGDGETFDFDATIRSKEEQLVALESQLGASESSRSKQYETSETQREAAWALSRLAERLASLARLAEEREHTIQAELSATTEAAAEARVAEIERQKAEVAIELGTALAAAETTEALAVAATAQRHTARAEAASIEHELSTLRGRHRDSVSRQLESRSELSALRASLQASEQESGRVSGRVEALDRARKEATSQIEAEQRGFASFEETEVPLDEEIAAFGLELQQLDERSREAGQRLREAEREAARWKARADMRTGSSPESARRIAAMSLPGVIGVLSDVIDVPNRFKRSVDALVGASSGVLVVEDAAAAARVIAQVDDDEAVGILIGSGARQRIEGLERFVDSIKVVRTEAADALSDIYLAKNLDQAIVLAERHATSIFLTAEGAIAMGRVVSRGPADINAKAAEADALAKSIEEELSQIEEHVRKVKANSSIAESRLNEQDAAMAAAAERLAAYERELHAIEREASSLQESLRQSSTSSQNISSRIAALEAELPAIASSVTDAETALEELQNKHARAVAALESATAHMEDFRIQAGMATERKRLLEERLRSMESALHSARQAASGVEGARDDLSRRLQRAIDVAVSAKILNEAAVRWAEEADLLYAATRASLSEIDAKISELRSERAGLAGALDDLRVRARQEDLGRSELRIRTRILEERMSEEWQVDPDEVVEKFGHVWEIDDPSSLEDPLERLAAMDEEALRRKHVRLERDLAQMGRVNPLAAQEFEALTQREDFLAAQIGDVRASRRDLFKVIATVDAEIKEMFRTAFEDVAREYERLFAMLFPGGQGRLTLTEPANLLETGVEVEARPGGKNLKRLSLLSGGERALSALAVLFAIFRARPSPFYVLDEVEAALDDVNLHRFLGLLKEFQQSSQLLVVSHQKRTMEIADVLYGVSIRPDGASRVISERLSALTF